MVDTATPLRARVWLEGLLPEGGIRSRLADDSGIDPDDTLAFLAVYGKDTAGALVLVEEGHPDPSTAGRYEPLDDEGVAAMLRHAESRTGAGDRAGLTSSSFEMAAKGGLGVELELERVPMRESGMNPYELMLSESQERMLIVLKPGREAQARMQGSSEQARALELETQAVLGSLGQLDDSLQGVHALAFQIAAAAEQQAATTQEVNQHMHRLNDMTGENRRTAAHTRDCGEHLRKVAGSQEQLVAQFQL